MISESFDAVPRRLRRFFYRHRAACLVYCEAQAMSHYGHRPAYLGRIALARRCKLAQSTIQRCLALLEQVGLLVKRFQSRGGRGISNVFDVILTGCKAEISKIKAYTHKLTDTWVTRSTLIEKKKEEIVAIEEKAPDILPGSPKYWIARTKALLKSPKN